MCTHAVLKKTGTAFDDMVRVTKTGTALDDMVSVKKNTTP